MGSYRGHGGAWRGLPLCDCMLGLDKDSGCRGVGEFGVGDCKKVWGFWGFVISYEGVSPHKTLNPKP